MDVTISNLSDLQKFYQQLPDGAMSDGIPSDLEAGNFDNASIGLPNGEEIDLRYTGPVQDGYISPFER
jgi:hypothetical protein